MIGRYMGDLVGQDGCNLGLVIGQRQKATGYIKISTRQRECVDCRGIQNRDVVRPVGIVGESNQRPGDGRQHLFKFFRLVLSPIGGQNFWMFTRAQLGLGVFCPKGLE